MGKWAGLPHGGPLSCSSTTPRRWKPPVALRELSWVACSSPWILEESWVVICASRHKTQTKPIILQSLAEVTDDERGFLLGGRGIGRGLGRGVKTVSLPPSSSKVLQAPWTRRRSRGKSGRWTGEALVSVFRISFMIIFWWDYLPPRVLRLFNQ